MKLQKETREQTFKENICFIYRAAFWSSRWAPSVKNLTMNGRGRDYSVNWIKRLWSRLHQRLWGTQKFVQLVNWIVFADKCTKIVFLKFLKTKRAALASNFFLIMWTSANLRQDKAKKCSLTAVQDLLFKLRHWRETHQTRHNRTSLLRGATRHCYIWQGVCSVTHDITCWCGEHQFSSEQGSENWIWDNEKTNA